MHHPRVIGSAVLATLSVCLFFTGCAQPQKAATKAKPTYTIAQQFTAGTKDTYEVGITVTKDFKFEQPALDKLRKEETTTDVRMTFDQAIQSVDESGWALAQISIKGLTCKMIKQNDVQIDYDSSRESDQKKPLSKLIGQSYMVKLSPDGKAKAVAESKVTTAGISGLEGTLAKRLFTVDEIVRRHEVLAFPDTTAAIAAGDTWERIVPSPPGLLSSKSYKKVYTAAELKDDDAEKLATITMTAGESAVPAEGAASSQGDMGIFAKMLDNEDDYTGKMVVDLKTGRIKEYNEKLISSYIAQETNPKATADQGPDTLIIRFIQSIDRKLID